MASIQFISEKCKGCNLCIGVCPKKIISLDEKIINSKGFHPAFLTSANDCIKCGFCITICPDCAIEME